MNPHVLFWLPAVLRLALAAAAMAILSYAFNPVIGFIGALLGLGTILLVQMHFLYRLGLWLENPGAGRLPSGWGTWRDVFSGLYRLRRSDEKHRAELEEWLARFRQAMTLLPDGVVIMDDVLCLEWCNPSAERHFGLDCARDNGRRVTNLLRNPAFVDYIILGRYDKPLLLALKDRRLVLQVIPFENRRQILVSHDATEADRLDRMRRDFVANASHELRTPITVINGFLEIACHQPEMDCATRQAHLNLMAEQGKRMHGLIEDMLMLTRLESVDTPLRRQHVDMQAMLARLVQEAQALSGGRHTILLAASGPDIDGCEEELHSAFINLVSNAVRYTPGNGNIQLCWQDDRYGPRFVVRDSGIGIDAEHIPRLTERFYRVDAGRSRATRGTGLGLAIVRHVLVRHRAMLTIDSIPGNGSTFTVTFPPEAISLEHAYA
ncbi:phosphate regulon sensor histidine kinase PhoR [Noviherbaspirillum sp. ST9]|uniref:phosphate regulon sensor histidine kinase PhoR n=1 Tax=Noviherbaspirillum sp. ST9 TaxID=3401606 RepID=UPI003B588972